MNTDNDIQRMEREESLNSLQEMIYDEEIHGPMWRIRCNLYMDRVVEFMSIIIRLVWH